MSFTNRFAYNQPNSTWELPHSWLQTVLWRASHIYQLSTVNPDTTQAPATQVVVQQQLSTHVIKTTGALKSRLDLLVAKFFYSCNIPFSAVEHPSFKTLMEALRPGYQVPTRKQLSGNLLDDVTAELTGSVRHCLNGKIVTLAQDGWSNIHNDPVLATCVTTDSGTYFLDATDTGSMPKTADNCKELCQAPVAAASNICQRDNTGLALACHTWLQVSSEGWGPVGPHRHCPEEIYTSHTAMPFGCLPSAPTLSWRTAWWSTATGCLPVAGREECWVCHCCHSIWYQIVPLSFSVLHSYRHKSHRVVVRPSLGQTTWGIRRDCGKPSSSKGLISINRTSVFKLWFNTHQAEDSLILLHYTDWCVLDTLKLLHYWLICVGLFDIIALLTDWYVLDSWYWMYFHNRMYWNLKYM